MLGLAVVFIGGHSAFGTDYVWDGDGPVTELDPPGPWVNAANWVVNSGYPDDSNDNAYIEDVTPSSRCTYNPPSPMTVNNLSLIGSSPTKMIMDIDSYSLTVGNAVFGDYAQLEADNNFTVTSTTTFSSGDSWFRVESGKTIDLENVDTSGTAVHIHATTTGTLKANDVSIDANSDGAARGIRFSGGAWDIEDELIIKAVQGSGAYIAKFWLDTGSVTPEYLTLNGGDDTTRRVEMDIDQNFTIGTGSEAIGGYYSISVAPGKTMNTKRLVLSASGEEEHDDIYFSVTGESAGGSQGQLITDAN